MCCGFLSSQCEVAMMLAQSHRADRMGKGRNWDHTDGFTMCILGPALWMHQPPYLECGPLPAVILQAQGVQRGCSAPLCGPEYRI